MIAFASLLPALITTLMMVVILAVVVRFVLPRERIRDQFLVGAIGALWPLMTLAMMEVWQGVACLADFSDRSGLDVLTTSWGSLLPGAVGIVMGTLMFLAVPRHRWKDLLPAFALGGVIGLLPTLMQFQLPEGLFCRAVS